MISVVDADRYELNSWCYAAYGFEYKPGFENDNAVCIFFSRVHVSGTLVDAISFLSCSTSPGSTTRVRGVRER